MSDSLNRYTVTREPSGGEATELRRYENCETKPSQTKSHGFSRIRKLRNEANRAVWTKRDRQRMERRVNTIMKLPNEPMRSARQFKVPSSRFHVSGSTSSASPYGNKIAKRSHMDGRFQ